MEDWKEYKLGEVLDFKNGKTKPKTKGNYPIYGGNGILGFADNFNREGETIIIGRVGAYCGSVYYENNPVWVSDNALSTKPKNKNHTKFFYYFLKGLNLNQWAGGSSHPLLTQRILNSLEFRICDNINEQRAIASVLSSLDDKIDLLHRQNQTLEAMAETLFREWFVERAEEDWEIKKLSDVVDISIGRTPPRKEFHWFSTNSNDVKWISIKDLGKAGIYVFDTAEYLTTEAVEKFRIPIIPKNTVVLSFKMTVGRVAITSEDMLSNEAIAHFKFNDQTIFSKEYLYLYLKTFRYENLGSTSSIVTSINSRMIKEMEIIIPDTKTMDFFRSKTENMFLKIKTNQMQIRTLTQLRDTLLPKLMSGEVGVNQSVKC